MILDGGSDCGKEREDEWDSTRVLSGSNLAGFTVSCCYVAHNVQFWYRFSPEARWGKFRNIYNKVIGQILSVMEHS
jgi:hypothetical protein